MRIPEDNGQVKTIVKFSDDDRKEGQDIMNEIRLYELRLEQEEREQKMKLINKQFGA
jgi:hypothetical protein